MYLQISALPNSYITLAGWVSRNSVLSTNTTASVKGLLSCVIPPALEITFCIQAVQCIASTRRLGLHSIENELEHWKS